MKAHLLPLAATTLVLLSCSPTIDDYHYGYAPAYRTLPPDFAQVDIGGTPYWHHGGRFYRNEGTRGYVLVDPPRGHEAVVVASNPAATPTPTGPPTPAPAAERRSWISPGGGTLGDSGPPKSIGRSPVRRSSPARTE